MRLLRNGTIKSQKPQAADILYSTYSIASQKEAPLQNISTFLLLNIVLILWFTFENKDSP
jgi:hypothetical protein